MKNFKNLAFGLVAGALALGFSAFTNVNSSKVVAPFLVQTSADQFEQRTGSEPTGLLCSGTASLHCYYERVDGQTLPAPQNESFYTEEEIADLLSNGIIQTGTNSNLALYTGS